MQDFVRIKCAVYRSACFTFLFIVFLLLLLGSCKKDLPLTIGYMGPLSGSYSNHGLLELQAVEMAVDELNQNGGIGGQKIRLVVKDTKGEAGTAKRSLQNLIAEEKIIALIGPAFSAVAMSLVDTVDRMQIPMITASATNAKLTSKSRFAFRTIASDSLQSMILGPYIANILDYARMAVIYEENSYSESLAKNVERYYSEAGGTVVASMTITGKEDDYFTFLQQVQEMEAQVLFLPNYIRSTTTILANMQQMSFQIPVVGGDGFYTDELLKTIGDSAQGVIFPQNIRPNYLQTVDFERRYQLHYQMRANTYALTAYDAAQVLLEALKKAHTEDQGHITGLTLRKYIAATNGYIGASGPITFNEIGDVLKGMTLQQIVDRKLLSLGDFTVKGRQLILLPIRPWLSRVP